MEIRAGWLWTLLLAVTSVLLGSWLFFTLYPGRIDPVAWQYFTSLEIAQGRSYHQIRHLLTIVALVIELGFLIWLVFSGRARTWADAAFKLTGSYYRSILVFFLALWMILRLLSLPFAYFSGYILQSQWGFSTQTAAGWWGDYLKGSILDLVIAGAGALLLYWSMNRWPRWWWAIAGLTLTGWMLVSAFLWPLTIAPLFNRFTPVSDPQVLAMVGRLTQQAGIHVGQVLEMDATRRTTRANAYFSGMGNSRRIVLYDTLLDNYSLDEIEGVLAHELAHWQQGHIARGIWLGSAASWLALLLLLLVLPREPSRMMTGVYHPSTWATILLFTTLFSLAVMPAHNYFSRQMERDADRIALQMTGNQQAAVQLEVKLARHNKADVDQPPFVTWLTASHPPVLQRIQATAPVMSNE